MKKNGIKDSVDNAPSQSNKTSLDPLGTTAAANTILKLILGDYHGPVAIRLWNGDTHNYTNATRCTVVFRNPAVLRKLILGGDLVRFAEAHLADAVDAEGDLVALFDLIDFLSKNKLRWATRFHAMGLALRLWGPRIPYIDPNANHIGHSNTKATIAHHYDLSNDFYRLWLDPEMVYSCAYFHHLDQPLASAQCDKLDYICRKLRLSPGQRLLDIGCGWGALVCWAAQHYGVEAHGITLSKEQYAYATERIRNEGLDDKATVEFRDYRNLPQNASYDRVVSVGMFEHIGIANFPLYFDIIKRVLKPGGLFLNHGITNNTGWQRQPTSRFINRYVFPDGELAQINDVIRAMEQTEFEIMDVESLRRHYALTLRRWISALESHKEQAIKLVGEATYKIWRLYMAGSAHFFDRGGLHVYQILAGHRHHPPAIPLRRNDLYTNTTD